MTGSQFQILSAELNKVAPNIPISWGRIQNNKFDKELKPFCNIFNVLSVSELDGYISHFDESHQIYYRRRWFLIQCSACDEYLFYQHDNVNRNPDCKDKEWDIVINNSLYFDVKSTRLPKKKQIDNCWCLQSNPDLINNPKPLIEWYYCNQSKDVRNGYQNRLFIVHHSYIDQSRENIIRTKWKDKDYIISQFLMNINNIQFIPTKKDNINLICAVIYVIEDTDGIIKYKFSGFNQP